MLSQLTAKTIPLSTRSQQYFSREVSVEDLSILEHAHSVFWIYAPDKQLGMWSNIAANRLYGNEMYFKEYDWGPFIGEVMQESCPTSWGLQFTLQQLAMTSEQHSVSTSLTGPANILLPGLPQQTGGAADIELIIKPLMLTSDAYGTVNCALVQVIEALSKATTRSLKLMGTGSGASYLFDGDGNLLTASRSDMTGQAPTLSHLVGQEISENILKCSFAGGSRCQQYQEIGGRWTLYDASPLKDPITLHPAVLVQTSDVTALKQDTIAAVSATAELQRENAGLRLFATNFLQNQRQKINVNSLADRLDMFLTQYVDNNGVEADEAKHLQQLLLDNVDLYDPVGLELSVRESDLNLDEDVLQSLLDMAQSSRVNQDSNESTAARLWPDFHKAGNLDLLDEADGGQSVLTGIHDWNYDVLKLQNVRPGCMLMSLGMYVVKSHGLLDVMSIDQKKLARFLSVIESGYSDHPYHNAMHATNVLYMTSWLLKKMHLCRDPLIVLSCLFAAIIHDYDHTGVTNEFLIRTHDVLAIRYNDTSPLENHHLAAAFAQLLKTQNNFLENLPTAMFHQFRRHVIDLVLATDMSHHFSIVNKFKNLNRPMCHDVSLASESTTSVAGDMTLLKMAIKCADIAHVAAEWKVHQLWVGRLQEEMWRQGDREKELQVAVGNLMDRSSERGISKSQTGFFEIFAKPTFAALSEAFPDTIPLLHQVQYNHDRWLSVG